MRRKRNFLRQEIESTLRLEEKLLIFWLFYLFTWIDSIPLSLMLSRTSGYTNSSLLILSWGESLGHTWSKGSPLGGSLQTASVIIPSKLLWFFVPRHSRLNSLKGFWKIKKKKKTHWTATIDFGIYNYLHSYFFTTTVLSCFSKNFVVITLSNCLNLYELRLLTRIFELIQIFKYSNRFQWSFVRP